MIVIAITPTIRSKTAKVVVETALYSIADCSTLEQEKEERQ